MTRLNITKWWDKINDGQLDWAVERDINKEAEAEEQAIMDEMKEFYPNA